METRSFLTAVLVILALMVFGCDDSTTPVENPISLKTEGPIPGGASKAKPQRHRHRVLSSWFQ